LYGGGPIGVLLETGMQLEVHYVWPAQFLIDCAVGSKRLRRFLRRPAGCGVGPPKAAGPKELRQHN
jgi:hypothetical protein